MRLRRERETDRLTDIQGIKIDDVICIIFEIPFQLTW